MKTIKSMFTSSINHSPSSINHSPSSIIHQPLYIALLLVTVLIGCSKNENTNDKKPIAKEYWTCTMHPQVHMDRPGACPICGMDLIKKVVDEKEEPTTDKDMANMVTLSGNKQVLANVSTVVVKKENLLPLDSFTVNLAQGEGPRRYVRLDAVLKMSDDAKAPEFEARKPQIRDTIISILNTKRADDLLKKEGKTYLKEEIKASINSFLVDGRVEDIYYISFQIN